MNPLNRALPTLFGIVVMALVGCAGDDVVPPDNAELVELYEADQGDRSGPGIDWSLVSPRDSLRRVRVLEMLDAGEVRTSEDHRHAAMVFQHGSDTTAARIAHELARTAVEIDSTNADAKWLMAAAWDRYLMRKGVPQWYGTQFVSDDDGNTWRLYDIDTTAVNDTERVRQGVPTLAETMERIRTRNEPGS